VEVRIDVDEYGSLVIRPQPTRPGKDNIFVGLVDEDANENEMFVLTTSECSEFIEALTLIRDKAVSKYFGSVKVDDLGLPRID